MNRKVSAGPYTLELPPNGIAVLYQDGQRLPGGVGYLEALVQFAGEVVRLQAMLGSLNKERCKHPTYKGQKPCPIGASDCWERGCQWQTTVLDPRDPDYSRPGIFATHNCWKCKDGADLSRCPTPDRPGNCGYPHARND